MNYIIKKQKQKQNKNPTNIKTKLTQKHNKCKTKKIDYPNPKVP